ncbi:MAG TPA: translocation/assembly module TamB domain-containing protein [Bacteroidales bacterium]|nr:translocation/assembly module TamB domain-containing protein [Bacteroidales bacterium]
MASRKIIKKLAKITAILLLIVFALPASAFLLLQSNRIQNDIAAFIMNKVSAKFNTRCSIGKIDIAFFYRIRINDVYLEDITGDTLIYARSVTAGIRSINPVAKTFSIGSINVDRGKFYLAIDSAGDLNIKYFLDKLKGNGTKSKGGWTVELNNLRTRNSTFSLKNANYVPKDFGINYSDMQATGLNADVRRFSPSSDSLSFFVKSLSFKEKSGLTVENMSCLFSESKTFLSFRNLEIRTTESEIKGDEVSLRFASYSQMKGDSFPGSVKLRIRLDRSVFNLSDLSYVSPSFRNIKQQVTFSGRVSGTLNNLRGKDLYVGFGNYSHFAGDLSFEGLPQIKQTFIVADINEFITSESDLKNLQFFRQKNIRIPEILNKLGRITYNGNFTGFINDFVAYGKFNTALGVVRTDLLFRPDTSNTLGFQGKLNAQDFNIGELANASDKMGKISLTATVDGASVAGKSVHASLKGNIGLFEFMKYEYSNISLSGDLNNRTFNGSVNVHDPNVDLEFLGRVDITDSVPDFDFRANITDANLYELNITPKDPDFKVSCYLIANAHGQSINTMNGEIKLLNSLFVKKDKQLQVYDLTLSSKSGSSGNFLQLKSDFLDAELSGNYELTGMAETVKHFIFDYFPSLADSAAIPKFSSYDLAFTSKIKNIRPLFDFFLPDYGVAENSLMSMRYNGTGHDLNMHFEAAYVKAKNIIWDNLNINASGSPESLHFEAGSEIMSLGKRLRFENFTAIANSAHDTSGIQLKWNNWKDVTSKGMISAMTKFNRASLMSKPGIEVSFKKSEFIARDTVWNIQPGMVRIDSSAIRFDNIAINHLNEFFKIDGNITENPEDVVTVVFNHFDLGNLNSLSASSGYNLDGVLNGNAKLSGIYSTPFFTSMLHIDSLVVNNEMLGATQINSSWNNRKKAIELDISAMRDNLKTVNITGEYLPTDEGRIDFDIRLEKLRMNILNPYLNSVFSDIRGMASGKATLKGTLKKPVLNGEIALQKSAFTINYLKTRYSFSDKILIENNNMYFNEIRVFDPKGNSAYLSGVMRSRYLKDLSVDLNIRSENFLCLNTTLADNKTFYGTAYATGTVKMQGPLRSMTMDIVATSGKNTNVKIPLSNTGELNEYPFIEVSDVNDGNEPEEVKTYQADFSGLNMRFKLIMTPDAEVQMIIDPVLGEIIKGRGNGNLDIRMSSRGGFTMSGDYVIEEGDYLFTLQKVINKKLTIEPGGTIHWDGDPLDATINLIANYSTRSSLADLLGGEDDQKLKVDDRVTLTGKLMSPDINYDVYLPDADESTRLRVNGAMATTEEKTKQFISLLITNRFSLNQEYGRQYSGATSVSNSSSSIYSSAAGVNFSELLSNQLSNWLSQIVNDLDVNVNYRSNREMNSDEYQVALSYPLFNNKLIINGSVDMSTNAAASTTNQIVGEFDIDYKLTDNGKLRLKTFNHSNNESVVEQGLTQNSTYTQGLGITYKEDFNTLGELLRRLFGKKEESPEPVDTDNEKPVVNNLP